jgi:hypothetical protein
MNCPPADRNYYEKIGIDKGQDLFLELYHNQMKKGLSEIRDMTLCLCQKNICLSYKNLFHCRAETTKFCGGKVIKFCKNLNVDTIGYVGSVHQISSPKSLSLSSQSIPLWHSMDVGKLEALQSEHSIPSL